MKFNPIGIVNGAKKAMHSRKASDYSNDLFGGIQLRRSAKNGPVIIMRSKRNDPLRWKVVYGFSSVFFRTFEEAVEFCNHRNMTLVQSAEDADRA